MRVDRPVTAVVMALLSAAAPRAQQDPPALHPDVRASMEQALAAGATIGSDRLWQACSAAHGTAAPLIEALNDLLGPGERGARAARLLIGVLRYEGMPQRALRADRRIDEEHRNLTDELMRAEVLDTVGRGKEAMAAYDALLARELAPELRRKILFRRALMDKESTDALEQFARAEERTTDERNQAAMVLALRDRAQAAVELFAVRGESTQRFRDLIRLAEWALAAEDHERAQQLAWEAVEVARMRRDHRYALTVAVSAFRAGEATSALLQRFEAAEELSEDARQVWIDLLRDEGRVDDALRLFRDGEQSQWTPSLRRQLLEICRDTGREEVLVSTFRELIRAEPDSLEWRSGLSRHHLENGDRAAAEAVWTDFAQRTTSAQQLLDAAYSMRELGLDDLALRTAEQASDPRVRQQAGLFVVGLHLARGRFEQACAMLDRTEAEAGPRDPVRAEIAGYYERMDRIDRAVEVLEQLRVAHDGFLGTDLDMKFGLLLSKVDREQDALEVWRALWVRMRNTPRGRYVEDRMMTVASRLGVLARIAIELEERLENGTVSTADVELLVRLYIKVGDSAAATEIIEEYLQRASAQDLDIIRRKANVYLACQDYVEYERMIEQLVEHDEENRLDHLRELLLSRLERGRRDQAIEQLPSIRAASVDDASADEFEAGVFQLAGLTDRALTSYVRSLGRHPDRIDTHLLVANLMRENGAEMQAARRFQYLASSAAKDDLFTIAIDGILNLRAVGNMVPDEVVDWAMRLVLERLARKPGKFYLYRLAADLAEELGDMPQAIRTLVAGLPVAGERRAAILRELLGKIRQLDPRGRNLFGSARQMQISDDWDPTLYVTLGRRLLGQGEIVPPQVYMDLATVFLKVDAVADAMRTFSRAAELLDRSEVHRQAAQVLEAGKRYDAALEFYRRLLAVETNDVGLLVKIAQLEELRGRDEAAAAVYRRGLETALQQTALRIHVATEEESEDLRSLYRQRNVDAVQLAVPRFVKGLLVTLDRASARALVDALRQRVDEDLRAVADVAGADTSTIAAFPRLQVTADTLRRVALCFRSLDIACEVDARLLQRFPEDREFAKAIVRFRADRGFQRAALEVVKATPFATDPALAWIAGGVEVGGGFVAPAAVAARIVPLLGGDPAQLRTLLENIDTSALTADNLDTVPVLLGACAATGATEAAERIARAAVRADATLSDRDRSLRNEPGMAAVKLAGRVDPDLRLALTKAIVDQAIAKGAEAVVRLRYRFDNEDDLQLDAATAERLLKELVSKSGTSASGYVQGMELLRFVPAEERADLLRGLHYEAPKSVRLNLLTRGCVELTDPVAAPFVEWFEAAYAEALRHADDNKRNTARFAGRDMKSVSLDLARLRALITIDSSTEVRADLIARQIELEDRAEAERLLAEGVPDMLAPSRTGNLARGNTGPNKSHIARLVRFLHRLELIEPALELVEQGLRDRPEHAAMRMFQWMVMRETPTAGAQLGNALRRHPKDTTLLEIVYEYHRDRGHLVESAEVVSELAKGENAERWNRVLASLHRRLGKQPPKQAIGSAGATSGTTSRATGVSRASLAPSVSTTRGVVISSVSLVLAGSAATGSRSPQNRPRPVPRLAQQILAEKDPAKARQRFRESWRQFDRDSRIVFPWMGPQIQAPPDVLAALAGLDWMPEEAASILRIHEEHGWIGDRGSVPELLRIVSRSKDPTARLRALAEELDSGRGGNVEAGMVLELLASDEVPEDVRTEMLGRLERRIEMPDSPRLRMMAREFARLGRVEAAAVLYRLSVLGKTPERYSARNRATEQAAQLFAEIEERLEGELGRDTVLLLVDDLLHTQKIVGSNAGTMEALALRTWGRLLPAEEAVRRARGVQHSIDTNRLGRDYMNTYGKGPEFAVALAGIFGAAGDLTAAVEEWGQFVRRPTAKNRFSDVRAGSPRRPAQPQLVQFMNGGGDRPAEWVLALAAASLDWHRTNELKDPSTVVAALAGACAKITKDGSTAILTKMRIAAMGGALVAALRELGARDTKAQLELAKVERAFGHDDVATEIEVDLLGKRRLPIADHARVVGALAKRDGWEAAVTAGAKALEYTSDLKLLEALVALCDKAGQPERAKAWRAEVEARKPKPADETDEEKRERR